MVHGMESEDPPRKIYTTKPREFERVNAPPGNKAGKSTEHDVYAILQQNRSVERQAGLNEVEIRPVRSRQKRDYWLLLVLGNALFGLVGWIARNNAFFFVSAVSGAVIFSVGLTWIMWVVMNDY
jgi:predicted phage tail protein